ncbi:MAG: U32 family peptidase, partial [Muribaculaceae bacterium]|nr:U32 family peptidase [Muribaculaceae bacterium]
MNAPQYALELLAPARNADIAIEAIRHGADAVYMGPPSHGARVSAANSVTDIARVTDYAHQFNSRVYVTINTLIYDDELLDVEHLIHDLYRIGVDALIVQDMAVLKLDIPPIALHASTQCDIRTPEKAQFLEQVGFSQLVLPREFSIEEIRQVRSVTSVPLEAFVHGALCVSYSGDCQASFMTTGRSANRGCCAQLCRLPYDLEDRDGHKLMGGKHFLSLRDMNRTDHLKQMIQSGISSFKIEGRLKDADYVKNTVAAYHQALNK